MGISRTAELANWRFSAAFPPYGGGFSNGGGNLPLQGPIETALPAPFYRPSRPSLPAFPPFLPPFPRPLYRHSRASGNPERYCKTAKTSPLPSRRRIPVLSTVIARPHRHSRASGNPERHCKDQPIALPPPDSRLRGNDGRKAAGMTVVVAGSTVRTTREIRSAGIPYNPGAAAKPPAGALAPSVRSSSSRSLGLSPIIFSWATMSAAVFSSSTCSVMKVCRCTWVG